MYLNIVTVRLWSDLYCARQLEMRRLLLGGALSWSEFETMRFLFKVQP